MVDGDSDFSQENSSNSIQGIWKPAQYGESALFDDVVRFDPSLAKLLQPKHGFMVVDGKYRYSVKVYADDRVFVYKNELPQWSSSRNRDDTHQKSSVSNLFRIGNFNQKEFSSSHFRDMSFENKKITDIKLVKLDELFLEEGWEIHYHRPILVIKEEPFVTLVKWEVNKNN